MQNTRTLTATIIFLTSVIAWNWNNTLMAAETKQDVDAITQLETDWSNLYGARDLDGIMQLMAEKSVLIVPGSAPINRIKDIREATRVMLESGDEVSWKSDFAFVSPSGDMAYDYGTAITKLKDGTIVKGSYLVVWTKENGKWKVAADMFN